MSDEYISDKKLLEMLRKVNEALHEKVSNLAQQITDSQPTNKEAWLIRGETSLRMGKYDEALKSFEKAAEIDPMDAKGSELRSLR
ncbi:MAG: tetratricopeptide repeat protein [Candidatus Korarchaeota archaeon]